MMDWFGRNSVPGSLREEPPLPIPPLASWRTAVAALSVYGLVFWGCSQFPLRSFAEWLFPPVAVTAIAVAQLVMCRGRHPMKAAFLMGGVVISLAVLATALGAARGGPEILLPALFLLPVLFLGGGFVGLAVGFVTSAALRWISEPAIDAGLPAGRTVDDPRCRRNLLRLLGVSSAAIFALTYWSTLDATYGEHTTPDRCAHAYRLPAEASDVCFFRAPFRSSGAYEFHLDEAAFRKWVEAGGNEVKIRTIEAEPLVVRRYCAELPGSKEATEARIVNGWYREWTDGGRTMIMAYDRDAGRAYGAFFPTADRKGRTPE